jgi:hypothetical protein
MASFAGILCSSAGQRHPLSRGSSPASYPTKPLVSFQSTDNCLGGIPVISRLRGARPTADIRRALSSSHAGLTGQMRLFGIFAFL